MLSFIFGDKKGNMKLTNVAVQSELVYIKFEITVTMPTLAVSRNLKLSRYKFFQANNIVEM